jgi:voltage-gated potassium channel
LFNKGGKIMSDREPCQNAENLERERFEIVEQLQEWLEWPMIVLGLAWLVLLVLEFVRGSDPVLSILSTTIWVLFIADFALKLLLAPRKWRFIGANWLTVVSLAIPALRVLRVSRVLLLARAGRGLRLVRVVASLNRGMRALRSAMARRGFGYVIASTTVVVFAAAAGMLAFEREVPEGLDTYGDALWWTAMIVVTMGSGYWPQTGEGKLLCLGLSLYGFGVLGYVTATLASFFVGRDAADEEGEIASDVTLRALCAEVTALRRELAENRRIPVT